jgi:hypothetical protein
MQSLQNYLEQAHTEAKSLFCASRTVSPPVEANEEGGEKTDKSSLKM